MLELDKNLSRVIDRARNEPVQVYKYSKPWVWILAHYRWGPESGINKMVPVYHPIRHVNNSMDNTLRQNYLSLKKIDGDLNLQFPAEFVIRCVVLQLIYNVQDESSLQECIGWNLLFRWFIGLDLQRTLTADSGLDVSIRQIVKNETAVALLYKIIMVIKPYLDIEKDEFKPNFSP
ncbi:transposase [Paenalcaligenes niemegkensis]|uniref:transposase n=1 Tax=Paenalcaligenes niemegkensis TaxID=2895469 RepID=UPI001EE80ACF|nr:transposase [Paenalcaligenes niemegkensis]MCQ9617043.1 transposase [Paenalcaligenes niemegkensis]